VSIYIFTGPTLSAAETAEHLDAVVMPPIAQGDIYRIGRRHVRAIGIIDGYFEHVPAVWHKEILWAIRRGIPVFGSASMGALRAAELEAFGMIGVGRIFRAFRDGEIEDDDEVAVTHAPADMAYRRTSEAMADIRPTLAQAASCGVIGAETAAALESVAKDLPYPCRSYPELLGRGIACGQPAGEIEALRAWLPGGRVEQKREDALMMLGVMRRYLDGDIPFDPPSFTLEHTVYCDRAMHMAGELDEAGEPLATAALLEELRLEGEGYIRMLQQARVRYLALEHARREGIREDNVSEAMRESFTKVHRLSDDAATRRWLRDNDLQPEQLEELVREEAAVQLTLATIDRQAIACLPSQLRAGGRYPALRARGRDKERALRMLGLANPSIEDTGLTVAGLLAWYFRRLPGPPVRDPRRFMSCVGFTGDGEMLRALLREYLYVRALETGSITMAGRGEGLNVGASEQHIR